MKYILVWILGVCVAWANNETQAQTTFQADDPSRVQWTATLEPAGPVAVGSTVTLRISATLPGKWHVYSVREGADFVFKPTKLTLVGGQGDVQLVGGLRDAGTPKQERDDILEGTVIYFEGRASYVQEIKILKPNPQLRFSFTYQICEFELFNTCVFPEVSFKLNIATTGGAPPGNADGSEAAPADTSSRNTGSASAGIGAAATGPAKQAGACDNYGNLKVKPYAEGQTAERSLFADFLLAIAGGLVALLTPCVFPMIPMTVSFFTKRARGTRQGKLDAVAFVASIIGMFTVGGVLISSVFGSDMLYVISVNPWVNLAFFLLLFVFGLSFLGLFDIALPSSWSTALDARSEKGGLTGIFFMAAALVVASFSCTGPIIGTQLVASAQGGVLGPAIVMFGFSLGFGIPFGFFAFFPGLMTTMPKSGGWLNSVKVVLGLLELALALKFLSMADLVWGTELLPRDLFLAIWVVIFGMLGLYLMGRIRFPHDHKALDIVPVPRFVLAVFAFVFALYLLPGLWGAPLAGLSGYLPPQAHNAFMLGGTTGLGAAACNLPPDRKFSAQLAGHTPTGFCSFFDLCEAQAYARQAGKPLFIDFTGITCANCRQVERNVWTNPEVAKMLQDEFVMVSLYADQDFPLTTPYANADGDSIFTLSAQVKDWQKRNFNSIQQPQYAILSHDLQELAPNRAYDTDVGAYMNFLRLGLKNFKASLEQ